MPFQFTNSYSIVTSNPDEKGRVRIVSFAGPIVRKASTEGRPTAPDPLVGKTSTYLREVGEEDLELVGFENGHLISLDLGGPNISENIAPMFSYFNQVTYRAVEKEIYDDRSITDMMVLVDYHDDIFGIPCGFTVFGKGAGVFMYQKIASLSMELGAAQPFSVPANEYWVRAKQIIEANLPSPKPAATPYAFLEGLRGQLGLGASAKTTKFSEKERMIIMLTNAIYNSENGGVLTSDLPGMDPFQTLVRMGGQNRPQVDHIMPKAWSGSNSFANAQLISQRLNNTKRDEVTEIQRQRAMDERRRMPSRGQAPVNYKD